MLKIIIINKISIFLFFLFIHSYCLAMKAEEIKPNAAITRKVLVEDCPIRNVPNRVLIYMFSFLSTKDIRRISCVSKQFKKAAYDDETWKYHNFNNRNTFFEPLLISFEKNGNKVEKIFLTRGEVYEKEILNSKINQVAAQENNLIKVTFNSSSKKRHWTDIQIEHK